MEVMSKVNEMVDQLGQTVRDQESALLNNIQMSMSFLDDDEEMNEEEYRVSVQLLTCMQILSLTNDTKIH